MFIWQVRISFDTIVREKKKECSLMDYDLTIRVGTSIYRPCSRECNFNKMD